MITIWTVCTSDWYSLTFCTIQYLIKIFLPNYHKLMLQIEVILLVLLKEFKWKNIIIKSVDIILILATVLVFMVCVFVVKITQHQAVEGTVNT